jgi:hypothetical protein
MTLTELRTAAKSMLAIFDGKIETQRARLLAGARILHAAEKKHGARVPTIGAAWKLFAAAQRQYNTIVRADAADKKARAEEARGKGASVREVHREISGLAGLDPMTGTFSGDPRSALTGDLGQSPAVIIGITIVVGVLGVAALTAWTARIVERIKQADSLAVKGDDFLSFVQAAEAAGWTRAEATAIARDIQPGGSPWPSLKAIGPAAIAIGAGILAVVLFSRRKHDSRSRKP